MSPVLTATRSATSSRRSGVVVQRLDGVDQRERRGRLALLLQQLGQVEPEVGFRPRRLDDVGQLGDRPVLVLVPPEDRAERQAGIDRVGRRAGRGGLGAEMADQVAQQIVALVELVGRAQDTDTLGGIDILIGLPGK